MDRESDKDELLKYEMFHLLLSLKLYQVKYCSGSLYPISAENALLNFLEVIPQTKTNLTLAASVVVDPVVVQLANPSSIFLRIVL